MTTSLPELASLESLRKQAKRLVRQASAGDHVALNRVHAQLPAPCNPLTLRDAQLVLAREYGFAGWQDLREAALRTDGSGLEWAAAEAESAIHDNNSERLAQLIRDYPALISWHDETGESLLSVATGSFGDSGDPYREQTYTRLECATFLLDAGAIANSAIWDGAIAARAKGVLELLSRRGILPRRLDTLAALGDCDGVQGLLDASKGRPRLDKTALTHAFLCACRFEQRNVAGLILDRCIELDHTLGERVESWRRKSAFVDYLVEHPQTFGDPWQTVVMNELLAAIDDDNLQEFTRWLKREPDLLGESRIARQVEIIEHAVLKNRGPFITRLLELAPALVRGRQIPPASALIIALDYGFSHLVPLLTTIWPLPDDLCHAAGVGDFARVRGWFDETGRPRFGNLGQHYPTNNPAILRNLHWSPPNTQQILDTALAWACVNRRFEIATFLLERGANINTDWSTHEPASILHECAYHGNYESVQFLADHGIDMSILDFRWNATAEGWARHAAGNEQMAEFLAKAEQDKKARSR